MSRSLSVVIAVVVVLSLAFANAALAGSAVENRQLAPSLAHGAIFGVILQRSRFCFLCNLRDYFDNRDPRGLVAILLAIAVGSLGYHVVLSTWLPNPMGGRLAPDAHIGPVGPVLALAGFIFGVGMTISGSCVSGHLYRLGEGSPTAPFALVGTAFGFALGFLTWNPLYVSSISTAPLIWLPAQLGYSRWLALQFLVLAALAGLIGWYGRLPQAQPLLPTTTPVHHALHKIFIERWPASVGGAAVGVLATVAYFQVKPLGVTAAVGGYARTLLASAGQLPQTLHGLDGFAGCRTSIDTLLTPNAVFVLGLIAASFSSALIAGQFQPALPAPRQIVKGLGGGVLLGWGAMTALGCTVGTLLSGTMAGAASGWVFLFTSATGTLAALAIKRRL